MPKKQRRTARSMFKGLLELSYQGSKRTLKDYVRKIKLKLQIETKEQAVRLEQIPGEAQWTLENLKQFLAPRKKYYYELVMYPSSLLTIDWFQ